jgi:replication factor A1
LVDDSKRSIRLTLWGENATSTKVDGNPIIACKGLRVSEFNGKNLSASTGCTIEVNPEIDESYALRGW